MDRRKILLVLAAVIAALGTLLVFLYVQGADERAQEDVEAVEVLKAVKEIQPGEEFDDAADAGKFERAEVPRDQVLPGAVASLDDLKGLRATARVFPGEQVTTSKFGSGAVENESLAIPEGMMAISVNLTDAARVAGFVNPGAEVIIFATEADPDEREPTWSGTLIPRVKVIGVGASSTITSTRTNSKGDQVTEEVPRTLITLAVTQEQATRLQFASFETELAFGLLTDDSKVGDGPVIGKRNFFPKAP